MSNKSVQKPAAVFGEIRNEGDVKAGKVNDVDETGDTAVLHPANVSGETRNNAGDVDDGRSAVELHHESDVKYVESDNEATIVESGGSETREHSEISSENKELHKNNENHDCLITKADDDEQEDILNVCEKDEVQSLRPSQLHVAAKCGDTEAIRRLLMSSANVDVLDTKHNTPLHIATLNGHIDVVNLLLIKNASVNFRNALGQTSLHLAAEIGHFAIAQILLDSNADVHVTDQVMNTPIHIAAMHGHYELVQLLMKYSALLICYGNTPLHLAAKFGHIGVVQLLLNYDENSDATNLDGDTALHLASENGHLEVAEVLLRSNTDANVRSSSFETPLKIAAEMGYAEIVKLMIEHKGEVNAVDIDGDTALHYAASNGHFEVVEDLLRNNADINIRNASGMTPLHFAADMGYAEIVKLMIEHKGEVNAVDTNGDTALHYAACNGHSAVVNVLLNQTTEIDAQIRSQLTVNEVPPVEYELSKHAIRNKVDVDQTSNQIAAEAGNFEKVNLLSIVFSAINAMCKMLAASHQFVVEHGHAEIVENLIFSGANVNACNNAKMTALHLACQNGHTPIVEILLDNHATVDVTEQSEETPFYLAAKNGHADISDILLRRGVCDFVEIDCIETPLQVAVKEGHTEVVEVILKHCSRISVKLTKVGEKLHEDTKTGMPVELLKGDDRLVSAGVIWTERYTPLEKKGDSCGNTPFAHVALSILPRMFQLSLSEDQCTYSETDVLKCFRSTISDKIKYSMNLGKLVQFLISSSEFNVNQQNLHLNKFFHDVISHKHECSPFNCATNVSNWQRLQIKIIDDVIQLLLGKGADFNMKNSHGETPLIIASEKGCCHVIQILFDWENKSGIKLDLDARDRCGSTALIKAAKGNHAPIVRLLLNHKASVNMYDYYGFTALHAAIYEPHKNWFDFQFFCKTLRKRKYDNEEFPDVDHRDNNTRKEDPVDLNTVICQIEKILEHDEKTTRSQEEIVNLFLDNDETNVNAIDFGGNTPLDLAVKSSKRITAVILNAHKNRDAIRKLQEPEHEMPIDVARVDERGRNPFHRLMISRISQPTTMDVNPVAKSQYLERFGVMVRGILLRQENLRDLATATDDKGRTPLHYAVISPSYIINEACDLVRALLDMDSNANAADTYGKTPLHYAEMNDQYEFLIQYGADENIKDKKEHTPKELKQLRELVTINEDNTKKLSVGKNTIYTSIDIAQEFGNDHVTELTRRKPVETIRLYSKSPPPEEAIWKIWTENEFFRLNSRLSQLKPLMQHFIERLADGIKKKDRRFECQPILVGSADEETKVVISADFDFNFQLIKFSQLCYPFPHPLGPNGYFQLIRKMNEDTKSQSDENFDRFFNLDQYLLTNEVNFRFKIILEEVLRDHNFWGNEHAVDWYLSDKDDEIPEKVAAICKTLRLRMIHPIEDGEGGFLFVNISVDIVACVYVEGWCSEDISPYVKTDGCTFVFDQPHFDPSKPGGLHFLFSETFVRISFAPSESRIIKESSPLIKAAYIVCKMILYSHPGTTYQLKTCLLFCMEALNAGNGSETRNEDEITPKHLAFWVERIMFCFMEFSRHVVYPCYFMPSFRQRLSEMSDYGFVTKITAEKTIDFSFMYSMVYDIYPELCPYDTEIDVPSYFDILNESFNANHGPNWDQFDREELMRKLSSRRSSSSQLRQF